jgi:hypothetical protein
LVEYEADFPDGYADEATEDAYAIENEEAAEDEDENN